MTKHEHSCRHCKKHWSYTKTTSLDQMTEFVWMFLVIGVPVSFAVGMLFAVIAPN
jgi:hypothetical protein